MSSKTCINCGRGYRYNDEVGYDEHLCSAMCDGQYHARKALAKRLAFTITFSELPKEELLNKILHLCQDIDNGKITNVFLIDKYLGNN